MIGCSTAQSRTHCAALIPTLVNLTHLRIGTMGEHFDYPQILSDLPSSLQHLCLKIESNKDTTDLGQVLLDALDADTLPSTLETIHLVDVNYIGENQPQDVLMASFDIDEAQADECKRWQLEILFGSSRTWDPLGLEL